MKLKHTTHTFESWNSKTGSMLKVSITVKPDEDWVWEVTRLGDAKLFLPPDKRNTNQIALHRFTVASVHHEDGCAESRYSGLCWAHMSDSTFSPEKLAAMFCGETQADWFQSNSI